jgi:hypothetical protein
MTSEQINKAILNIKPGLEKYIHIMDMFLNVDVSANGNFQRSFNGFYRIRQRESKLYEKYYTYMENNKNLIVTFEQTLLWLYNELGRLEPSFSSKLVATINPNFPIWDSVVLNNLKLKKPSSSNKDRVMLTVELYNNLVCWYEDFTNSVQGMEIVKIFDEHYPDTKITNVKKRPYRKKIQ